METRGGSLRLRGRARHSGKCGFRAVSRRPGEQTQDGARASRSVERRWVPRPHGAFPGAAGAGEAAEAGKVVSLGSRGSEASGLQGAAAGARSLRHVRFCLLKTCPD